MKTKIKQAQDLMENAHELLEATEDMLQRAETLKNYEAQLVTFGNIPKLSELWNDIDTCERGAKRLYESYLKTLTKIQEL